MKLKNAPYPLYDVPDLKTFREYIEYCKNEYSDSTAFSYKRKGELIKKNYTEFYNEVCALAVKFIDMGLNKSQIALLGENSYEWILTYFAVAVSGNIIVPIDKMLPVEQVAFIVKETEAKLLVCSNDYSDYAEEIKNNIPDIRTVNIQKELCSFVEDGKKIIEADSKALNKLNPDPDDLVAIIYTSGTTGTAKGVMLTHRNICFDAVLSTRIFFFRRKYLIVLPLHHTYSFASVLHSLVYGCDIFISNSVKTFANDIKEQNPYCLFVVPMMVTAFYKKIWDTAKENKKDKLLKVMIAVSNFLLTLGIDIRRKLFKSVLDSFGGNLESIVVGGSALEGHYCADFRAFGIHIAQGYGITECSPVISVNRNHHFKDDSVGLKLPNFDVKINKFENENEGEICVKGDCVMKGYWKAPDLTAQAFDDEGYFKTGDVGYIDDDGFIYITGRVKNMIILSNGKNVYPEEIEFEFLKDSNIKEILVYEKEQKIVAEIYPNADQLAENGVQDVKAYFDALLEKYNTSVPMHKTVSEIILRDTEFPKTSSMKIKREYKK